RPRTEEQALAVRCPIQRVDSRPAFERKFALGLAGLVQELKEVCFAGGHYVGEGFSVGGDVGVRAGQWYADQLPSLAGNGIGQGNDRCVACGLVADADRRWEPRASHASEVRGFKDPVRRPPGEWKAHQEHPPLLAIERYRACEIEDPL